LRENELDTDRIYSLNKMLIISKHIVDS